MEKKKYYVSLQSLEISQIEHGNNNDFTIYATDGEVKELRATFNKMYDANIGTYWRAHIPIVPYHHDTANDNYDAAITDAFQMLYELGDEKTKEFIDDSEVLTNRPIDI